MVSRSPHQPSGFEKLPAELYDEIFSYLPEFLDVDHLSRRYNVTNRVTGEDEMHTLEYLKQARRNCEAYLRSEYLKLLFVSRAFNRAITRVWFHHEFLILRAFDDTNMPKDKPTAEPRNLEVTPNCITKMNTMLLQEQLLPRLVRRLRIDLSARDKWDRKPVPWLDPAYPGRHPGDRESLLAFLKLLPRAMAKLERLECLWLNLDEYWVSQGPGYKGGESVPELDLVAIDELRNSLCSLFSPSYAHSFRFLTELRLLLPCTYDFAALNKAMSDEATNRLRHLYLEYIDATGPGGDRDYLIWAEDDNGYDGDEDFPPSNLQKRYPNYDYMRDICELVADAPT